MHQKLKIQFLGRKNLELVFMQVSDWYIAVSTEPKKVPSVFVSVKKMYQALKITLLGCLSEIHTCMS